MRIPKSLETLADHGVINQVLRPLMSGKEAQIYLVVADGQVCAAKIYKDAQNRSFKNRADYLEGRKVRNSRDRRAIAKGSKYGKGKDEDAWKSAEVDMIYRLADAGVRVPQPYMFLDGVLLMELVSDYEGNPAPRLGDCEFSPEEAIEIYNYLIHQVTLMLCAGVVHGDLSEFNVLMGGDGPVVIDFPQSINAAGNNNARALLVRDVENLHRFLARWVPSARRRPYAEELWSLYESNRLTPETELTGRFKQKSGPVDTTAVMELIGDANRDEVRRRRAQGEATGSLEETPSAQVPMRRREVIIEKPAARGRPGGGGARSGAGRPGGARPTGRSDSTTRGTNARSDAGSRRPRRTGGDERPRQGDGRDQRKNSGPKRGDQVQNSTYVSPEARKAKGKSLSLTPRGESSGSGGSNERSGNADGGRRRNRRARGNGEPSEVAPSGERGANGRGRSGERRARTGERPSSGGERSSGRSAPRKSASSTGAGASDGPPRQRRRRADAGAEKPTAAASSEVRTRETAENGETAPRRRRRRSRG